MLQLILFWSIPWIRAFAWCCVCEGRARTGHDPSLVSPCWFGDARSLKAVEVFGKEVGIREGCSGLWRLCGAVEGWAALDRGGGFGGVVEGWRKGSKGLARVVGRCGRRRSTTLAKPSPVREQPSPPFKTSITIPQQPPITFHNPPPPHQTSPNLPPPHSPSLAFHEWRIPSSTGEHVRTPRNTNRHTHPAFMGHPFNAYKTPELFA